jgi:hypothetical protein
LVVEAVAVANVHSSLDDGPEPIVGSQWFGARRSAWPITPGEIV